MKSGEPSIELLRHLGSGATAQVELGRLRAPFAGLEAGTEVAVKKLCPELRDDVRAGEAFAAEARAGREARDPSLVRVLHQGVAADGPYLLLQYVPGRTLRGVLDEDGGLPEPLLRDAGAQLAGALAALHRAGLVHGDVKPENVRLDSEGRAVLLDLGFARRADGPAQSAVSPGAHAGSLAYLSPERARGGAPSAAADCYALGVVLYELATGVHPFGYVPAGSPRPVLNAPSGLSPSSSAILRTSIEVAGADDLLATIARGHVNPPSYVLPQLSPFLDGLLIEVLRRSPASRPALGELREWLRAGESSRWWRARVDPTVGERPEGPGQRESTHLLPLAGREKELAELRSCWGSLHADEAKSGVIWLSGPQGSGKWRLVTEFVTRARESDSPPLYLYARSTESSEARPTGSLLLLLHRWLQLPPGTPPGVRENELLRELLHPRAVRTLLQAVNPEVPTEPGESVAAALAEWLAAVGARTPVAAFLDDLHRSGTETLGALGVLVRGLAGTRVLLVLGLREDTAPASPEQIAALRTQLDRLSQVSSGTGFRRIELAPLDEEAIGELVEGLFHKSVPRMRLARVLWKRSRGNPGLIKEIVRRLIARGEAVPHERDGLYVLEIAPDDLPLPSSLDRMIAERVGELDDGDRRWLGRLGVVGGRISPDFLVRAFPPTTRHEIDEVLGRLVRLGWLVPAADRYRFQRPALREAVYRGLTDARRKRLHLAAARGLESTDERTATTEERFQRAFHLRAAEEHEELFQVVLPLLRAEGRRASAHRLHSLSRWALEALDKLDPDAERNRARLELLEVGANAADRLGLRQRERELLDHMVDLEEGLQTQPGEASRLYLLHGRYAAGTGQFGLARGMLRNALELAAQADDGRLESEAARRQSHVQGQIGELVEARALAERALERATDGGQRALAHLALAQLDVLEDRVEDALREVDRALRELRVTPEVPTGIIAHAQLLRARVWRSAGRPERAMGAASRAVRLARRTGERRLEAEARARLGGLLLDLDHADQAEAQLRDALLVAGEIEDRRGEVLAGVWLGLLLMEGHDHEALASIERAAQHAREIGFHRAEAVALAFQARVRRERKEWKRADQLSQRAMELLERHGAEMGDRITIVGTRALLLTAFDRRKEARELATSLREHMRRANRAIQNERLRHDQHTYTTRLLAASLSAEGPVYPRTPAVPE